MEPIKKRVRKTGVWTVQENELLIAEVKKREFLWNNSIPEYRDKNKRLSAWEDISEIVGQSAFFCRTRWDAMRSAFRTTFQKMQANESGTNKPPHFYVSMLFLVPVIKTQKSNLDAESRSLDAEDNSETFGLEDSLASDKDDDEHIKSTSEAQAQQTTQPTTFGLKRKTTFELPRSKRLASQLNKYPSRNNPIDDAKKTPIFSSRFIKDDSSTYGDYIASKHRKYSEYTKSIIEHLIADILFKADMGRYETDAASDMDAAASSNDGEIQEADLFHENIVKNEIPDPLIDINTGSL